MLFGAVWESDHEGLVEIRFAAERGCRGRAERTRVVRAAPDRSGASTRREPDPCKRDEDRGHADQDDREQRKPRIAHEPGTLARAARVTSGPGTRWR